MNRTDRMMAIVLELQRRKNVRAEDLAAKFETSVRTIYRDVQALSESGVPVVALPGTGYALEPSYFLPPLRFSPEEATMLLLGGKYVAEAFDTAYKAAALQATEKIEAAMDAGLAARVAELRDAFAFVKMGGDNVPDELAKVRNAMLSRRKLRIRYFGRDRANREPANRTVHPYALAHVGSNWYLSAFCESAQDMRHFRLGRILQLEILDDAFERDPVWAQRTAPSGERPYRARVRFHGEIAHLVSESYYYVESVERDVDGTAVATIAARTEDDLVHWLLGWGAAAEVLEPALLREHLCDEARKILERHLLLT